MKKIACFGIACLWLFCFTGCESGTPQDAQSGGADHEIAQKSGIVYVQDTPVSYTVNGKQQLIGEYGYALFYGETIAGLENAPPPTALTAVDTATMYASADAVHTFKKYNGDTVMNTLYSDAAWDLFPAKVQYEHYTYDNQPNDPAWTTYLREKLDTACDNTPLFITGAWLFDWNGDGKQDALVQAGNAYQSDDAAIRHLADDRAAPNPPPSNPTVAYQMTVLFTSDGEKQTATTLHFVHKDLSYNAGDDYAYSPPTEAETPYRHDYCVLQRDAESRPILCPIFTVHDAQTFFAEFTVNMAFVLCDVDGNQKPELITYSPTHNIAPTLTVYHCVNNKPIGMYSVAMP